VLVTGARVYQVNTRGGFKGVFHRCHIFAAFFDFKVKRRGGAGRANGREIRLTVLFQVNENIGGFAGFDGNGDVASDGQSAPLHSPSVEFLVVLFQPSIVKFKSRASASSPIGPVTYN
jgi:hypothetical protein